jgi:hypothetical protein
MIAPIKTPNSSPLRRNRSLFPALAVMGGVIVAFPVPATKPGTVEVLETEDMEVNVEVLVLTVVLGSPQSLQQVEQGLTAGPVKLTSEDAAVPGSVVAAVIAIGRGFV